MDRGLASDSVRERAKNDLPKGEPQEHGRDDELNVVSARRPEVVADHGQRRQYRVNSERDERHQKGDEGNEFAKTKGGSDGRFAHFSSQGVDTV